MTRRSSVVVSSSFILKKDREIQRPTSYCDIEISHLITIREHGRLRGESMHCHFIDYKGRFWSNVMESGTSIE